MLMQHLEGLRDKGNGQYVAKCPAHADKSPSLTIKVEADGTVLLHCFAGCTALEVVNAVGLTLGDLFPEKLDTPSRRPLWNYRALLETLGHETLVGLGAATKILDGYTVTPDELEEVKLARLRIAGVMEATRGR